MSAKGSCLCGKVTYQVNGELRDVIACHCHQCRKQSGHYYAATNVADAELEINGNENLTWYQASPDARRGFCTTCGSALFWKHNADEFTSILAGSLDNDVNVKLTGHIFVADKGTYYDISDDLPQFEQGRS